MKIRGHWMTLVAGLTLAACGTPDGADYLESWGSELIEGGRADRLFDAATPLTLGKSLDGAMGGSALVVHRIDLRAGDAVDLELRVTAGDLSPHLTLFEGVDRALEPQSFSWESDLVRKTYVAERSGRHFLVVRPYRAQGEGDYSLAGACQSPSCGVLAPEAAPAPAAAAECVRDARECTLDAAAGEAVGPARARTLFDSCLSTAADVSCQETCFSAAGRSLCEDVVVELPFFTAQPTDCRLVLDVCMDDCRSREGQWYSASEVSLTAEAICWRYGLNATCPDHARRVAACGGRFEAGSEEACYSRCLATDGAWVEEPDPICEESCDLDWTEADYAAFSAE